MGPVCYLCYKEWEYGCDLNAYSNGIDTAGGQALD
jgi:hypothetical protein